MGEKHKKGAPKRAEKKRNQARARALTSFWRSPREDHPTERKFMSEKARGERSLGAGDGNRSRDGIRARAARGGAAAEGRREAWGRCVCVGVRVRVRVRPFFDPRPLSLSKFSLSLSSCVLLFFSLSKKFSPSLSLSLTGQPCAEERHAPKGQRKGRGPRSGDVRCGGLDARSRGGLVSLVMCDE